MAGAAACGSGCSRPRLVRISYCIPCFSTLRHLETLAGRVGEKPAGGRRHQGGRYLCGCICGSDGVRRTLNRMGLMFPPEMLALAGQGLGQARARGLRIATAESCTGGLIAGALTAIPGSSEVFERGFGTYSNQAKTQLLAVPAKLLTEYGAESREL